jgi:hypothetical protein
VSASCAAAAAAIAVIACAPAAGAKPVTASGKQADVRLAVHGKPRIRWERAGRRSVPRPKVHRRTRGSRRPIARAAANTPGFNVNCWVQGAYLSRGMYSHKATCSHWHMATVTLKQDGVIVDRYVAAPTASNGVQFTSTFARGVPMSCASRYQVVVVVTRTDTSAAIYWTTGVPRFVC